MNNTDFLLYMESGAAVRGGGPVHRHMSGLAYRAMEITGRLNACCDPAAIVRLFAELTDRPVHDDFRMFPPFYTDCGLGTKVGRNVFINSGCRFQDQGGITIGDNVLIGHNAVIATLNHALQPDKRADMLPAPVKIGDNVWLGANVTIVPGVCIGNNSVIAAGAVVTKDVPRGSVMAGVPARFIKSVTR